jgi:DNA polymerase I-like protein with 3'-5' exonuclease and polymerase domains
MKRERIVALDIETGINGGENPFADTRDVVSCGWQDQGGQVITTYDEHEFHRGTLTRLLAGTKVLITFNGKFDVQHLTHWPEDYAAWQDFVAEGGVLWDCQLAEYLLRGMHPEVHYLSLNEVSATYGGDQKIDAIAELWAAGVQTRDIDRDLLLEYLTGDVKNTRLIFEKQIAVARERGQLKSLLVNFGALCCSIEMERNGMFVDRELAEEKREVLAAEVVTLKAGLEEYVPAAVKSVFNWGSRYHKSALLFGGVVKVPGYEYDLKSGLTTMEEPGPDSQFRAEEYAYAQKTEKHWLLEDGSTVSFEQHLIESPARPISRFKSGINAGEFKTKNVTTDDYTKPKGRKVDVPHTLPGHIDPLPEWASSPPGVYKVGSEVMEVLEGSKIPFVATLVRYTGAAKDLGTYFWVEAEDGTRTGMLTKVGADGLIHHKINHVTVVTGRLSSSDPNLQNLPRKDKSTVKYIFRSRFSGGSIGQSDFSSLEVYVQAMLTRAKVLTEALKKGLDVHVLKLSLSKLGEGKSYDELLSLCKGPNATPEWKEKRTQSKEISFQDAYGAGPAKIAKTTGMSVEDVIAFQSADREANPEIGSFFESLHKALVTSRQPHGEATPHPEVAGVICHLGRGEYITPDGKRYGFTERPALRYQTEQGINQNFSPTEEKNYVVQGTGGEIAKMAMWIAVREFYRHRNFDHGALLVNQVHDAVYIDAALGKKEQALMTLHACMLAASPAYERYFDWQLGIHVPAETTYGDSLADENAAALPEKASMQYMVDAIVNRYFKERK